MSKDKIKSMLDFLFSMYSWCFVFGYLIITIVMYVSKDLNLVETYKAFSLCYNVLSIIILVDLLILIVLLLFYVFNTLKDKKKTNIERLLDEEEKK